MVGNSYLGTRYVVGNMYREIFSAIFRASCIEMESVLPEQVFVRAEAIGEGRTQMYGRADRL